MKTMALRAHQKNLELAYDAAADMPRNCLAIPGACGRSLVNLVGNAIKFTQPGEVLVTIESRLADDRGVELHFKVTDTGIGIPAEKQGLLFKAFSQADSSTTRKYGGTGLGLAISARLVELMGGKIWVESSEGKGSTFHFTAHFTVGQSKAHSAAPALQRAERTVGTGCRRQRNQSADSLRHDSRMGNEPFAAETVPSLWRSRDRASKWRVLSGGSDRRLHAGHGRIRGG